MLVGARGDVLRQLRAGCVDCKFKDKLVSIIVCFRAVGSDTGGSVRLPASYTGIVGYKPTWGLISRYGLVSYAPSLDTVGLMARSVGDTVICLEGLLSENGTRNKWRDPTLLAVKSNDLDAQHPLPLEGIVIGVVEEWLGALKGISGHPLENVLNLLESRSGARLKLVNVAELEGEECLERYYEIACMEASSTLARYSGNFFEQVVKDGSIGSGLLADSTSYSAHVQRYQAEMFGIEVQRRIERGRGLLSDPEGRYLKRAEGYRSGLRRSFEKLFREECCDVLIGPTAFSTAPTLSDGVKFDSKVEKEDDLFTVPANLAGLPAVSLPLHGFCDGTDGVIGTQLMAAHLDDRLLLRVARELEKLFK